MTWLWHQNLLPENYIYSKAPKVLKANNFVCNARLKHHRTFIPEGVNNEKALLCKRLAFKIFSCKTKEGFSNGFGKRYCLTRTKDEEFIPCSNPDL